MNIVQKLFVVILESVKRIMEMHVQIMVLNCDTLLKIQLCCCHRQSERGHTCDYLYVETLAPVLSCKCIDTIIT